MTYEDIVTGLSSLKAKDFADYVPARLDELTDAVMELPAPERAIPELFALMERLPDADLGSPGPLVHTLERMDYTAELVASLHRRPTALSVWMVTTPRCHQSGVSSSSTCWLLLPCIPSPTSRHATKPSTSSTTSPPETPRARPDWVSLASALKSLSS